MTRLDDMIAGLCPAGVAFKQLAEVAAYSDTRVDAAELDGTTFVGVDNLLSNKGGKVDASYLPNTARLTAYEAGDVLLGNIRPYLKKVWLATGRGGCSGDVLALRVSPSFRARLIPKFLYYLISSDAFFAYDMQHAKGAKMPRGSKDAILRYRIPVPPLEVQRKIVRVLDTFTELEAGLEAELTARERQYGYYREHLLAFGGETRMAKFGEVATIVRGGSPRPIQAYLTDSEDGINWIKIGDVASGGKYITTTSEKIRPEGASKSRRVAPGDFVLSNSMSFGRPYILQIDGCIHDGWLAIMNFDGTFLPDFLYHVLRTTRVYRELARQAGAGTVQNLNAEIVRKLVIPVPSLPDQERIVELLDKFDALVNDPSIGLPAELNARRKQYEYYRDSLLTFREAT